MLTQKRYILAYDHPTLRKVATSVDELTPELKDLIADMVYLTNKPNTMGIAAPQLGVSKRIIVVKHGNEVVTMINPVITSTSEEKIIGQEGCLSIPGVFGNKRRSKSIIVSYYDVDMQLRQDITYNGIDAVVAQHECQHLDGILFTDGLNMTSKIRGAKAQRKNSIMYEVK